MRIKWILLFLVFLFFQQIFGVSDSGEAFKLLNQAIKAMDNGQLDESIDLLLEAEKLNPNNMIYSYEIGYAYLLKEDYKNAISNFSRCVEFDNVVDQCYQMLGNSFDLNNQPEKAIQIYTEGLIKFPASGCLYLELGNMEEDDLKAATIYEKGIEVEPGYSSNYYWASKIYGSTTETIWSVLYSELFLNLERGGSRALEISSLLYDTYKKSIIFEPESKLTVSFSQEIVVDQKTLQNNDVLGLFPLIAYESNILLSCIDETEISISSLNRIRTNFIDRYYNNDFDKKYPNILFDWHKKLIDLGYFESYNYWLFNNGNPDEFENWYNENTVKLDEFLNWFSNNPMPIDNENKFIRYQYD